MQTGKYSQALWRHKGSLCKDSNPMRSLQVQRIQVGAKPDRQQPSGCKHLFVRQANTKQTMWVHTRDISCLFLLLGSDDRPRSHLRWETFSRRFSYKEHMRTCSLITCPSPFSLPCPPPLPHPAPPRPVVCVDLEIWSTSRWPPCASSVLQPWTRAAVSMLHSFLSTRAATVALLAGLPVTAPLSTLDSSIQTSMSFRRPRA